MYCLVQFPEANSSNGTELQQLRGKLTMTCAGQEEDTFPEFFCPKIQEYSSQGGLGEMPMRLGHCKLE